MIMNDTLKPRNGFSGLIEASIAKLSRMIYPYAIYLQQLNSSRLFQVLLPEFAKKHERLNTLQQSII